MKILVIGSGGREHAVIKKLKENPLSEIYALPGNGGIAADAECVNISATDIDSIVRFAVEKGIEYAVVTPDDPLALGAVDRLNAVGIDCFGPTAAAAQIEASKVFAKNLMKKYAIPTAAYEVFTSLESALDYARTASLPMVIKADGLALGKGVIIAETREDAASALRSIMGDKIFGKSGNSVVIEDFLQGPEVSVLAFTDGECVKPMVSSMDHKRALDGDKGLNTGGMGTIAPNPYYTPEIAAECMEKIFLPTVRAMKKEGRTFRGCLYFGLMLTDKGAKVIEYNCRFGDPETQVVLPLVQSDLLTVMRATTDGTLAQTQLKLSDGAACCVVLASEGYPQTYKKGFEITVPSDVSVCFAGAKRVENGKIVTNGGRVLGVIGTADTLRHAVDIAYDGAERVQFANKYYRRDIGKRALSALSKG